MKVLKFGGTSLKNLEMIKETTDIILKSKKHENLVVVVSAMSQVTNLLLELCILVESGDIKKISILLEGLKEKHFEVIKGLYVKNFLKVWKSNFKSIFKELEYILKGATFLNSNLSNKTKARVLYFGEIFSSKLLSLSIKKYGIKSNSYLSKNFLICSGDYLDSDCKADISEKKVKKILGSIDLNIEIPVITGFGGGDLKGNIYLFDRGGSDYVATLIGKKLKASSVEIWTDVSGVMSADPRIVKNPIIWKNLNYAVAAEFALVGAKVIHPKTISPIQKQAIPIYIKNTFAPNDNGTKISDTKDNGIKGISIDNEQVILTFIDPSMISVSGYIYKVVEVFDKNNISIDTFATTETSFSITIRENYYSRKFLDKFLHLKQYLKLEVNKNVSKITLVGDNIKDYKVFDSLDNVLLISSGAFGKSLTIFVKKTNPKKLLKKLHLEVFGR